jgi:hypothetical protein
VHSGPRPAWTLAAPSSPGLVGIFLATVPSNPTATKAARAGSTQASPHSAMDGRNDRKGIVKSRDALTSGKQGSLPTKYEASCGGEHRGPIERKALCSGRNRFQPTGPQSPRVTFDNPDGVPPCRKTLRSILAMFSPAGPVPQGRRLLMAGISFKLKESAGSRKLPRTVRQGFVGRLAPRPTQPPQAPNTVHSNPREAH